VVFLCVEPQQSDSSKKVILPLIVGAFVVVVLGVVSAWFISSKVINKGSSTSSMTAQGAKATDKEAGVLDPNVKYDNATGTLQEGGINNQGTHHLERDGGPSHNAYLTSSVVDLSKFVGQKVEVWGQTLAAKKGIWLMDVAKVQVVQ
jgi:hypothetical protein